HFYSGTSHAAGKYKETDAAPGYWNSIIGPGKAIDTNKYFVLSADTFANLNTKDPNVFTTGPSSINPDTGKPYGMSFPVVSMRDSVRVHKALLDSLGVKKLAAVAGASGGSIQAMEWGALYPDFVARVIHVIGPGFDIHPYVVGLLDVWVTPIRLDPRWNGGDYYGREEPLDGVAQALKIVTLTARHWGWAERTFGYKFADEKKDPAAAPGNNLLEVRLQVGNDRHPALNIKVLEGHVQEMCLLESAQGLNVRPWASHVTNSCQITRKPVVPHRGALFGLVLRRILWQESEKGELPTLAPEYFAPQ
ncbi:alpha/beta fold hydrolase, partial [bacterium]